MSSNEDKDIEQNEDKQEWRDENQEINKKNSLEQLKQLYESGVNNDLDVDRLFNICSKMRIHYLTQQKHKLQEEDFKTFIKSLRLTFKNATDNLLEKNKKPLLQYILVNGSVSYNLKSTNQQSQQSEFVGFISVGFLVYPEIFMSPKSTNLSIKCQSQCLLFSFNQEVFNKFLKKSSIKQSDKLCQFLHQIPLFNKMPILNLRKYLSFFLPKIYKYNDIVYESQSEKQVKKGESTNRGPQVQNQISNSSNQNQLTHNRGAEIYFIKTGEVEVYGRIKRGSKMKTIKIIALESRQCFGIQEANQSSSQKIKYLVRSTVDKLQVLTLNRKILQMIQFQNPIIKQSFEKQKSRITEYYELIMRRNRKILKVNMQLNPHSNGPQLTKNVKAFYNISLSKTCEKSTHGGDVIKNPISTINNWDNNKFESNKTAFSNFFPPYFNSPSHLNSTISHLKEDGKNTAKSLRVGDKIKKKKSKANKKTLAWWGLAENLGKQQKYRIPKLHNEKFGKEDKQNRVVLMDHKIRELKNRILQSQAEQDDEDSEKSQRQFRSKTNGYIPKIKARVQMFDARPKAIDMGEFIKKKLVNYAKNTSSFCDRLNLS